MYPLSTLTATLLFPDSIRGKYIERLCKQEHLRDKLEESFNVKGLSFISTHTLGPFNSIKFPVSQISQTFFNTHKHIKAM